MFLSHQSEYCRISESILCGKIQHRKLMYPYLFSRKCITQNKQVCLWILYQPREAGVCSITQVGLSLTTDIQHRSIGSKNGGDSVTYSHRADKASPPVATSSGTGDRWGISRRRGETVKYSHTIPCLELKMTYIT